MRLHLEDKSESEQQRLTEIQKKKDQRADYKMYRGTNFDYNYDIKLMI